MDIFESFGFVIWFKVQPSNLCSIKLDEIWNKSSSYLSNNVNRGNDLQEETQ